MIKASEAKRAAEVYYNKLVSDHAKEYKKIKAREERETEALWPTRGMMWVEKIEGWIKIASVNGKHTTYEPTSCNPDGDEIIYIGEGDRPIYQKLMQYFRNNGFTVEEYQYMGMKINW